MQKILKRVATAERVAAKRKTNRDWLAWKKAHYDELDDVKFQRTTLAEELGRAKQAIKDDWNLGPLSPNISVGDRGSTHGAISESRFQIAASLTDRQREARCAWLGGVKNLNITTGDRVVLLEGPDKGKIGKVQDVAKDTMQVTVEGLNKSNIRVPSVLVAEGQPTAVSVELPIPISGVRLVHPIWDPKTGETKDVIINQIRHSNFFYDRQTGHARWTRVVPGLNATIPWPTKPESKPTDYKVDTLRIDVEERTFVPTLLRPPMPAEVIDELRNKYSRFRTRHEPEYIAAKEAEEQDQRDRVQLMESMRTPLQELHRTERERKKKKGKPRLSLEMLEEIGRVIAKNREGTLNAAGLSDAAGVSDAAAAAAAVVPPVSETMPSNTETNTPLQ